MYVCQDYGDMYGKRVCILVVATFAFTSELNDRHASLIHGAKITITRTQEIDINGYRVFL